MKLSIDRFLYWLLIRSAEAYYGDSFKDLVITDKFNGQTINFKNK